MGNDLPDKLKELITPEIGDKVLEVGGGTGRIAQHYIAVTGDVWIIDPSKPMLREAMNRYPQLKLVHGYAEDQPFPSNFFDFVLVYDSFHHWDNYNKSLKEIARVLKPGGTFFIGEIHPYHRNGYFVSKMESLLRMQSKFFPASELVEMLRFNGFKVLKKGWIDPPTYYLTSTK